MDNDSTLICRAQAGDEGAFVDLIRAYHPFVYAIVIAIVNNPQDAEEIVQDTFLNVYRGLAQYEERAKFKTWLAEIARNCARSWMRKQRLDTVPIDELSPLDQVSKPTSRAQDLPDEQLIHREQRELIRRAIESLSPNEREVAHSYFLEGASYDELTSTHGLSYKAISVRLSRAKQKLAKRLGHLLTGVFVFPATTLKKIYSGGLTLMKVGTVPKITAGAVVIIVLAFIGTRQFILSKEDSSPSVEVVTSTESAQSVAQTDTTRKDAITAPLPEDKPQISAEEIGQIEDFFAQLEEEQTQSGTDTAKLPTDAAASNRGSDASDVTDSSAMSESTTQSAEDVMNAYVEAFKNLDFETMISLMTGTAKEAFFDEDTSFFNVKDSLLQIEVKKLGKEFDNEGVPPAGIITQHAEQQLAEVGLKMVSQAEAVSSEHVGDEFHFRLGMPAPEFPEIPGVELPDTITAPPDIQIKMRNENGAWLIYDMERLN